MGVMGGGGRVISRRDEWERMEPRRREQGGSGKGDKKKKQNGCVPSESKKSG